MYQADNNVYPIKLVDWFIKVLLPCGTREGDTVVRNRMEADLGGGWKRNTRGAALREWYILKFYLQNHSKGFFEVREK